ncbi:hypothetical protein MTP99_013097 [Tenebrio molitor]|jgi:hypothetical protein|nr:hypothetical protein MTP99_013097 [Tenebrio molitor]
MSGMGPASCWVTHKRLESWARAAKERALGTTSPKQNNQENGSNTNSSNNSIEVLFIVYTTLLVRTFRKIDSTPSDDGNLRLIGIKFAGSRK